MVEELGLEVSADLDKKEHLKSDGSILPSFSLLACLDFLAWRKPCTHTYGMTFLWTLLLSK